MPTHDTTGLDNDDDDDDYTHDTYTHHTAGRTSGIGVPDSSK